MFKNFFSRRSPLHLLLLLGLFLLLPACSETEGQINVLKDRIANQRVSNHAANLELQQLNQKLAGINRQMSAESAKRGEFEAKAKKSAATEGILTQYRTGLEDSLTNFAAAVAAYRAKYTAP